MSLSCSNGAQVSASWRARVPASAGHRAGLCQARRPLRVVAMQSGAEGQNLQRALIDTTIGSSKIVVFMKGVPAAPKCGFSNSVCQILRSCNVPFEGVNILADDRLRTGMKEYSSWPTFPQIYINSEFVGGADILISMYKSGELAELLEREMLS